MRQLGATIGFNSFADVAQHGVRSSADAIVVLPPEESEHRDRDLGAVLQKISVQPRATLVLQSRRAQTAVTPTPPALPVSYCSGTAAAELVARISTMIAMRPSLDALQRTAVSQNHNVELLTNRFHKQLRLASEVQKQMLPRTLPRIDGVTFHVLHRPAEYVSGDIYDIRQVDNDHVAFAIVDAEGHGISAAMLSVFIKRALRSDKRRAQNGAARLASPDRILARLNTELLETELSEPQFAAAVYAIVNVQTRRVMLARAGAPYPLIQSADGEVRMAKSAGTLLGIDAGSRFELCQFTLQSGESILIHSDGLDPLLRPATNEAAKRCAPAVGYNSAVHGSIPADETIRHTDWCALLQNAGPASAIRHAERRHDTLRRLGNKQDDLTILAVEFTRR